MKQKARVEKKTADLAWIKEHAEVAGHLTKALDRELKTHRHRTVMMEVDVDRVLQGVEVFQQWIEAARKST